MERVKKWKLTTPTNKHNIHVVQLRVQLLVDNIVLGNVQLRQLHRLFPIFPLPHFVHALQQQLLEQVAVAAVFLPSVADGDVAFQDRYTEGWGCHFHVHLFWMW